MTAEAIGIFTAWNTMMSFVFVALRCVMALAMLYDSTATANARTDTNTMKYIRLPVICSMPNGCRNDSTKAVIKAMIPESFKIFFMPTKIAVFSQKGRWHGCILSLSCPISSQCAACVPRRPYFCPCILYAIFILPIFAARQNAIIRNT